MNITLDNKELIFCVSTMIEILIDALDNETKNRLSRKLHGKIFLLSRGEPEKVTLTSQERAIVIHFLKDMMKAIR